MGKCLAFPRSGSIFVTSVGCPKEVSSRRLLSPIGFAIITLFPGVEINTRFALPAPDTSPATVCFLRCLLFKFAVLSSVANDHDEPEASLHFAGQSQGEACTDSGKCGKRLSNRRSEAV